MNHLKQFFWHCSGSDIALLKRCPTDSNKYIGIGATIFFTGLLAAISASYGLFTVFDSVIIAIAFGIVWGAMIFNLDRYIVSSMKKNGNAWRQFSMALPRLILAILIAVVISKPLELKIFESEIEAELILMEQEIFKEQEDLVKNRYQGRVDLLKQEIVNLKREIADKAAQRDQLVIIAQQEADGTGGSMRRNLGPIYRAKKADADKAELELIDLTAKNQPLIDAKLAEITEMDSSVVTDIANLGREKLDGMAARMDALNNLTKKSQAILLANWFIILLFIAIETAPIFVKLISNRGPYDELLDSHEHAFKVNSEEKINNLSQTSKERITLFNNESENLIDEKVNIDNDIRAKRLKAESEVTHKSIDHWKGEEIAKLKNGK
ncbi:DUF4407 domain-containing protein [Fulvivirgaceae bacterium BMA10]|uniref:DUF4407 domain-containing protein n=1 Tax=Splendidivirga corallicola TaxID=3051826 RepID=A0ABT8KK17_9BACT|nr:DUF4407 domain-containing protein [Fulvivirgaceae bacterium BMA10]